MERWFSAGGASARPSRRWSARRRYAWDHEERGHDLYLKISPGDDLFLWELKDHYGFKTLREAGAFSLRLARMAWPSVKAMEAGGGAVGQVRRQAKLQAKLLKKYKPKEENQ